MIKIRRQFIDGPYGQVHIRMAGERSDKTPLICLHQSPKSSREFAAFMEIAASDRLIIAIDNPGHGESDVPSSEAEATISNYVRSAWAVIDSLGLDKVDLLGNHTGSMVAVEMAFQKPGHVNQLVLISSPIYTEEEVEDFKILFNPIPLDEAGTRFVKTWKKAIHYRGPGVTLEHLAISYAENFRAGEAYEWGHDAAFDYASSFPERLKSLDHHIVVINPGDLIFEATLRAEPYLNNGKIRNYRDWGIGFLDAYPEDAVEAIKSALS